MTGKSKKAKDSKSPAKKNVSSNKKTISMDKLKEFIRTRGAEYLKDPNISSIGVGFKQENGKRSDEISIQFTVETKAQPENVGKLGSSLIPQTIEIDGVKIPTDVIQRKFKAEFRLIQEIVSNNRKSRQDPMMPGISVSNAKGTAGTIGCLVYDKISGVPYILSNWHVFHGTNGVVGDDIVQPGPYDDNRSHLNKIGRLVRSHLGQAGDCAISSIDNREFNNKIMELEVSVEKLGEAELGDKVIKSGRTTGVTHGEVTRIHTIAKIDYGGAVGEKEIGGFEIGIDPANPPENGEISMGGDSGSVWIFKSGNGKPIDVMAGLHFAGEASGNPTEYAIACYPQSVFEKLEISLTRPSNLKIRESIGFDNNFLSVKIDYPTLSEENRQQTFVLNGSEIIDYTHFSLSLNKERKFPIWVGWNVDGGQIKKISRSGIPFIEDRRIPSEYQAGDELYRGNDLDRGHIARRADLIWGPLTEAKKANKDSFYFTNITPQMDKFNQSAKGGIWGKLEDAVFEEVDVDDLRISIFGGPVFHEDDQVYRNVKIPREFWKVIMFVENSILKAKGFLLTQNLDQLEAFQLEQFKVYQVGLNEIELRCEFEFDSKIKDADSFGNQLSLIKISRSQRSPIYSLKEIDWTS
ncbi:MAG: DNA/RNA non-specific endonuclease [Candidatus Nitrosocosmicus sp.]|nr:DNA/RNA non-specific endonuclease [Candidatus Nitrosocosmicus sp.]